MLKFAIAKSIFVAGRGDASDNGNSGQTLAAESNSGLAAEAPPTKGGIVNEGASPTDHKARTERKVGKSKV